MKYLIGFNKIISNLFKILLFLSSYVPLFIILLLQNKDHISAMVIFGSLIIFPVVTLMKYISDALDLEPNEFITVKRICYKGSDSMNYIVGYIIPFLSLNVDLFNKYGQINWINLISIFILFSVIGNIYITSRLFYINPLLNIAYNISEVETEKGESVFIIGKKGKEIKIGDTLSLRTLSYKMFLYSGNKKISFD